MDKYLNSFCRVCGVEYHRCNCKSDSSWRSVADTAEHYKIFAVIRDYANEIIDANKANELLNKLDLTGFDTFRDNTKQLITDIRKKATPIKPKTAAVVTTNNQNGKQHNYDKYKNKK